MDDELNNSETSTSDTTIIPADDEIPDTDTTVEPTNSDTSVIFVPVETALTKRPPVGMDANVVRSLNQGPMGPQGPVKANYCIMNQEAGFEPVARIYSHKYEDEEEEFEGSGEPLEF